MQSTYFSTRATRARERRELVCNVLGGLFCMAGFYFCWCGLCAIVG